MRERGTVLVIIAFAWIECISMGSCAFDLSNATILLSFSKKRTGCAPNAAQEEVKGERKRSCENTL